MNSCGSSFSLRALQTYRRGCLFYKALKITRDFYIVFWNMKTAAEITWEAKRQHSAVTK